MLTPQEKSTHPVFRNNAFKQAVKSSVRLGCHKYTVDDLGHTSSMAVVDTALLDTRGLMWKNGWRCMLRSVRADQSEHTGLFRSVV